MVNLSIRNVAFARYEESEILSWAGPRVGLDVFGDEKISYEKVRTPLLRVPSVVWV